MTPRPEYVGYVTTRPPAVDTPARQLPDGTLTFMFTDIAGSTAALDQHPQPMADALARHDALVTSAIEGHGGIVVKSARAGDSFLAVFTRAPQALTAAIALQLALGGEEWPADAPIRVRVGLHTGEAEQRDNDYFGVAVNRSRRLMDLGHGGQMLVARITHDLAIESLPAGVWFIDHGLHRLKDLQRPEHVFQACHPDLPQEFPPLRSIDVRSNNLPVRLDRFVGRQAVAERVHQALAGHRLVTLTGAAGAGKTRLALHIAAEAGDAFAGGVWWIDLACVAHAPDVARAMAAVLTVRDEGPRDLTQGLVAAIGAQPVLLLLDNVDAVVAPCGALLRRLLEGCPNLQVLVTSRSPLGVLGERVQPIGAMAHRAPAADTSGAAVIPEAVELFLDRARLVRPDARIGFAERDVVAEICRQLDGLPLAIELAAARSDVLGPAEILLRLPERMALLRAARDGDDRHGSLRGAIALSYPLPAEEDRLLQRLAAIEGEFDLDVAERVGSLDEPPQPVIELLCALVRRSLVAIAEDHQGRTSYRILESIRLFAAEGIADAERARTARALAEHWCDVLDRAEAGLAASTTEVIAAIAVAHDPIRSALRWALDAGDAQLALRLAGGLGRFWHIRGHLREGRELIEAALALSDTAAAPLADRARAQRMAGILAYDEGDLTSAEAWFERSLGAQRQRDDPQQLARAYNDLALVNHQSGRLSEARAFYEQSLVLKRALGDDRGVAASQLNIGLLMHWEGDLHGAHEAYTAGLQAAYRSRSAHVVAELMLATAMVGLTLGDLTHALRCAEAGLQDHERNGDQAGLTRALVVLGRIARELDNPRQAERLIGEALSIAEAIGYRWGEANSLEIRAKLAADAGNLEAAREGFEACRRLMATIGDRQNVANALDGLGRVALAGGDIGQAARIHRVCLAIRMELGAHAPLMRCVCLEDLAGVAVASGDHEAAAVLTGAAAAFRDAHAIPPSLMARRRLEIQTAAAAAAVGQARWEAMVVQGRSKPFEEAVGRAVAVADAVDPPDDLEPAPQLIEAAR